MFVEQILEEWRLRERGWEEEAIRPRTTDTPRVPLFVRPNKILLYQLPPRRLSVSSSYPHRPKEALWTYLVYIYIYASSPHVYTQTLSLTPRVNHNAQKLEPIDWNSRESIDYHSAYTCSSLFTHRTRRKKTIHFPNNKNYKGFSSSWCIYEMFLFDFSTVYEYRIIIS